MNEEQERFDKQMLDALSKSVTALCEAIDPHHRHGPETAKIVAYAQRLRAAAYTLTEMVYKDSYYHDRVYVAASELRALLCQEFPSPEGTRPIVGGDRTHEMVPMQTDGGDDILVHPDQLPGAPRDGSV